MSEMSIIATSRSIFSFFSFYNKNDKFKQLLISNCDCEMKNKQWKLEIISVFERGPYTLHYTHECYEWILNWFD